MATRLPDEFEDIVSGTESALDEIDKRAYVEAVRYTEEARRRVTAGADRRIADLAALVIMMSTQAGRIEDGLQQLSSSLDAAAHHLREVTSANRNGNGAAPPALESKHRHHPG